MEQGRRPRGISGLAVRVQRAEARRAPAADRDRARARVAGDKIAVREPVKETAVVVEGRLTAKDFEEIARCLSRSGQCLLLSKEE
jgi:hypothetical protein